MADFERITTEYVEAEDRIRITGTIAGNASVIWLTQRLLQRLLPPLMEWLKSQGGDLPRADLLLSFAQQVSQAQLSPQPPVVARDDSAAWLVISIDLTHSDSVIHLNFRGANHQAAGLTLAPTPLHQWLSILHEGYRKAGWPLTAWPNWISECAVQEKAPAVVLH